MKESGVGQIDPPPPSQEKTTLKNPNLTRVKVMNKINVRLKSLYRKKADI